MTEVEARAYFSFGHLPEHLQRISRPFGDLAFALLGALPDNSQRALALQRLVEAKDCAVRALVIVPEPSTPE